MKPRHRVESVLQCPVPCLLSSIHCHFCNCLTPFMKTVWGVVKAETFLCEFPSYCKPTLASNTFHLLPNQWPKLLLRSPGRHIRHSTELPEWMLFFSFLPFHECCSVVFCKHCVPSSLQLTASSLVLCCSQDDPQGIGSLVPYVYPLLWEPWLHPCQVSSCRRHSST